MKAKTNPVITHTEILNRAISSIEAEIEEWNNKCANLPHEQRETMFEIATKELREKLDALKTLYRIEAGTDFV